MADEILWYFLVVDDKQAEDIKEFIQENNTLDIPNRVIVETCTEFNEALEKLSKIRIDLVVLDLKDNPDILDDENAILTGQKVFDQIRETRFVPVIFYTAYAHKVKELENPYVRVVEKSEPRKLRQAIKEVFETGLPQLARHLDSEQRNYMWDQVQSHWQKFTSGYDKTDLTYLLARRLANALERNSIRRFLKGKQAVGPQEEDDKIYPVEMYVYPPVSNDLLAGDVFRKHSQSDATRDQYWVMLTPSCDLAREHKKADKILLAECSLLSDQPEYKAIQEYWRELKKAEDEKSGYEPKQTPMRVLKQLLVDNRQGQLDRYKFLPGTFFLPDLLIDFQSLIQMPVEDISGFERVTSLDNPFSEACVAQFAKYYGRLGTPDLDIEFVYERLAQKGRKEIDDDGK